MIVGVNWGNMETARETEKPHQKTDDMVPVLLGTIMKRM